MPPLEDLPPLGPQGAAGAARRPAAAVAGAAVQQVQRDPAQVPYQLRFRFTDGSSFQADFSGATRLADVFAAVRGRGGSWAGGVGLQALPVSLLACKPPLASRRCRRLPRLSAFKPAGGC